MSPEHYDTCAAALLMIAGTCWYYGTMLAQRAEEREERMLRAVEAQHREDDTPHAREDWRQAS